MVASDCTEPIFKELYGVISTTSGYTGGKTDNSTYNGEQKEKAKKYKAALAVVVLFPIVLLQK